MSGKPLLARHVRLRSKASQRRRRPINSRMVGNAETDPPSAAKTLLTALSSLATILTRNECGASPAAACLPLFLFPPSQAMLSGNANLLIGVQIHGDARSRACMPQQTHFGVRTLPCGSRHLRGERSLQTRVCTKLFRINTYKNARKTPS